MRVAENDWDDRAGLRGHMQLNRYTGRERERERERLSYHAKDQSPGTGGEGQDRGGRRRCEKGQETAGEL